MAASMPLQQRTRPLSAAAGRSGPGAQSGRDPFPRRAHHQRAWVLHELLVLGKQHLLAVHATAGVAAGHRSA